MITITNLCKSFNGHKALSDLSLCVPKGKIFGLLGPNGAGKTTLISILNGIIQADSGSITVNGHDLRTEGHQIKSFSALIPQHNAFYPTLTAHENLEYFAALYGLTKKDMKKRIAFSVEVGSLKQQLHRQAKTFSGGLKRRLNLAIGLLNDPEVLYLDEPTAGVDPQSRNHLLSTIRKINKDKDMTIIYTSHYIEEVEQVCDHIGIIDHGKMIVTETKKNLTRGNDCVSIKVRSTQKRLAFIAGPDISIQNNEILVSSPKKNTKKLISVLQQLEKKNIQVVDIRFGYKKLEDIFMKLTSHVLRDK